MRYQELTPARGLSPFVRALWTLTGRQTAHGFELVLPDGHAELIVHRGDPFHQCVGGGPIAVQPAAVIAGQMERAVALASGGTVETVGVRFTPCGLAPLCGPSQDQLTDQIVDLRDVATPGLRRLAAQVQIAPSLPAALQLLQRGLQRLFAEAPQPDERLSAAVAQIVHSGGMVAIDHLHATLATSPRWLERHFRASVGVSPKRLARIVRFQRVLGALVRDPAQPYAAMAADHGYYDQAHFTSEFHAFTGHAPRRFVRQQLDELTRAFVTPAPAAT